MPAGIGIRERKDGFVILGPSNTWLKSLGDWRALSSYFSPNLSGCTYSVAVKTVLFIRVNVPNIVHFLRKIGCSFWSLLPFPLIIASAGDRFFPPPLDLRQIWFCNWNLSISIQADSSRKKEAGGETHLLQLHRHRLTRDWCGCLVHALHKWKTDPGVSQELFVTFLPATIHCFFLQCTTTIPWQRHTQGSFVLVFGPSRELLRLWHSLSPQEKNSRKAAENCTF